MAQKLTKRRVDAAKAGTTIWDGEIPGFGLRVSKTGVRAYVLKYRRGAVQRWLTIGRHGATLTSETARAEAKKLLGRVANNEDPAAERADMRNAETVEAFAETYLANYARPSKKASSVAEDERNLKNHILPALGSLRIRDVTRAEIARFHQSMRATPYAANRCRALLSHLFRMAERWGVRADNSNPCAYVEKFKEKGRERFLSPKELRRLGRVLAFLERKGSAVYEVAAIRLLLLTGARLSEILTLRWEHIDGAARLIRLADSKTGAKTIALSAPALMALASIPRQQGNPYVICGAVAGAHLVNLQKPWRRIRKAAGLDDVRLHDLRHSFASVAVAGGMSLPLIGSLLGHSQPQTTARYAHLADDPRLAAADAVAASIAASMGGETAKVIPLRKA